MDEDFHPPGPFAVVKAYLTLPIYFSAVAVHRVFGSPDDHQSAAWEVRIHYRTFLQGIPAILAVIAATVVGFFGWRTSFSPEVQYSRHLSAALNEKNFPAAEIAYTRLLGVRPDERQYRFGLGTVAAEQGDDARAERLIAPLAPADHVGYPPAHLWMIDRLLKTGPFADPEGRAMQARAEAHLIRLRDDPELGARVRQSLMELYLKTGRIDKVLDDPGLRQAAEASPDTRFTIVQELALRGRLAEVKTALDESIGKFEIDLRKDRDNERSRIFLCQALALRGDIRTAAEAAEEGLKLNPNGACGEVLAELMTARAVQVRTAEGLTDAERAAVYRRALELLKRYGRESTVNELKLAELARLLHDDGEVERRLLKAVETAPAARLQLADFYVDGKRPEEARKQWLQLAERYEKLDPAKKNDLGERLTAATAALRLEQFSEAERIIFVSQPSPAAAALRTSIYVAWVDSLAKAGDPQATLAERFDLLRKAFQLDPWNPALLQRLLQLTSAEGVVAADVRKFLLGLIAEGKVPAAAYLMLGTDALQHGDEANAFRYLENAFRLRPDAADVMNNLAWAYLHAAVPQPERALELATAALRKTPNDPRILDTRFRAYVRLEKWNEALADLEKCAPAMTGTREFHLAAAEVYNHVGQPAVAAEHRRRATLAKPSDR